MERKLVCVQTNIILQSNCKKNQQSCRTTFVFLFSPYNILFRAHIQLVLLRVEFDLFISHIFFINISLKQVNSSSF